MSSNEPRSSHEVGPADVRAARPASRGRPPESADILRIIAAVLLPPLGVFLQVGFTTQFWINILLTLLGYVPGIIHAVWIIARR